MAFLQIYQLFFSSSKRILLFWFSHSPEMTFCRVKRRISPTFGPEKPFGTTLEMREGDFALFLPMDAHAGKGASLDAGEVTIRKAVAKVAMELIK